MHARNGHISASDLRTFSVDFFVEKANIRHIFTSSTLPIVFISYLRYYPRRRGYGFHRRLSVCLSVCLSVHPHAISKSAAAMITRLDIDMIQYGFCKSTYFGLKRSKVKVTRHKKQCRRLCGLLHYCECCILLVFLSWFHAHDQAVPPFQRTLNIVYHMLRRRPSSTDSSPICRLNPSVQS